LLYSNLISKLYNIFDVYKRVITNKEMKILVSCYLIKLMKSIFILDSERNYNNFVYSYIMLWLSKYEIH